MNNYSHTPVLLEEAVNALSIVEGKKFIDATIGGGGHSKEILSIGGIVLGIDKDQDALDYLNLELSDKINKNKLILVKGCFGDIFEIAKEKGFEKVDGVLFDFGVSSYQIDKSGRGFSIKQDEKLDMRMDLSNELTAYDVVNKYSLDTLTEIFLLYGEEHNAKKIAAEVIFKRKKNPIETTKQLSDLIERIGHKSEAIHPATRVFQAIRIEVNNELGDIKKGLNDSSKLLNSNGKIVAISFHSLEDRIVKQTFEKLKRQGIGYSLTKKPLTATYTELMNNKRSRSAKMRIFEKK